MEAVICYHGTSEKRSQMIIKHGFRPDCWFATNLANAIAFGGIFVFEVAFLAADIPLGEKTKAHSWQFHVARAIPSSKIISLRRYEVKTLCVKVFKEIMVMRAERKRQSAQSSAR